MRVRTWQWAAACVALGCGVAGTTHAGSLSEQDFLGEVPVVLTVSRLAQSPAEAPAAVTVIDRDMIRRSGFRDLADVLRLVPGFYAAHFAGNEQVVSHGLNNRYFGRVQVLLDGMSVYNPMFGQVPWSMLPVALEDIERIEVTRGPNAASYGANSFLGVINIITRHPLQDPGTLFAARVGDPAMTDGVLRHGGHAGGWDFRVTGGYRKNNGFEARNDSQRLGFVNARGDYRIDERDSLVFQAAYSGGTFGRGYFNSNIDVPHDQAVSSSYQQLRWTRTYGPDDELTIQAYHTRNAAHEEGTTRTFVEGGIPFLPTLLRNDLDSERFEVELQRNQSWAEHLRAVWGMSARVDRVRAPLYLGTGQTQTSRLQRAFAHLEWRPHPDTTVNAGAMWEHNDITGSDLSPRLALTYRLAPGHHLRAGVSKALRTPTVLEDQGHYSITLNVPFGPGTLTVPYFFGDDALKPERILSRELAYLWAFPRFGLSGDVRLYYDSIRDIIVPVRTTGLMPNYFKFQNAADVTAKGTEAQLRWRYDKTQLALAHSYQKMRIDAAVNQGVAEDLLEAHPVHISSVLFTQGLPAGFEASLGYYFVSEMYPMGDGDFLPHHRRWDARLAKRFRIGGTEAEATLVVQNLFNPYLEWREDNVFETRAFLTLHLRF